VSEERRDFVLLTEVLPLPLLPGGQLPASVEGEELLGLELLWTAIGETEIESCTSMHLVRIQGTQNLQDVVLNQEVIAVIANQIAGKATREAAAKAREVTLTKRLPRSVPRPPPSDALALLNLPMMHRISSTIASRKLVPGTLRLAT
jgi:hypothetical protein